jgi:hypothetical protein
MRETIDEHFQGEFEIGMEEKRLARDEKHKFIDVHMSLLPPLQRWLDAGHKIKLSLEWNYLRAVTEVRRMQAGGPSLRHSFIFRQGTLLAT